MAPPFESGEDCMYSVSSPFRIPDMTVHGQYLPGALAWTFGSQLFPSITLGVIDDFPEFRLVSMRAACVKC